MADTAFNATPHPGPAQHPPSTPIRLDAVEVDGPASDHHVRLVAEVARRAAMPTWLDAAATTRATLTALGGWLDAALCAEVASHLPDDLGAPLTHAADRPRHGDVVALYQCVAADAGDDASLHEVALRCAAVLAVLGESLPPALVRRLTTQLPDDISALVAITDRGR